MIHFVLGIVVRAILSVSFMHDRPPFTKSMHMYLYTTDLHDILQRAQLHATMYITSGWSLVQAQDYKCI